MISTETAKDTFAAFLAQGKTAKCVSIMEKAGIKKSKLERRSHSMSGLLSDNGEKDRVAPAVCERKYVR